MIAALPEGFGALAALGFEPAAPTPSPDGWDERVGQVISHGLTGLLAEAWRDGQVNLEESTQQRVEIQLLAEARLAVRLEAEILRLESWLADTRAVILKGAGVAHGAYPEPSWRPFTDLDVLVPTSKLFQAIEGLVSLGYKSPSPDPSPHFRRLVGKATLLEHPCGLVVDLHRTLASGLVGDRIDIAELLDQQTVVQAGDVSVPVPSWSAQLIEVALHALIGDGLTRALSLRDIVQVACHDEVDATEVRILSERWGVGVPVVTALAAAHNALQVALPTSMDEWVRSRAETDPKLRPSPQAVRSARLRLDELHGGGLRRRAELWRALIAPSPQFLRWRYGPGRLPQLYWRRLVFLVRRARQGGRIR